MKISYSWTKNISQIINNHNNEITKEFQNRANNNNNNSKKIECNFKSRSDCPMNGLCNLVYQAIIYPKEDKMIGNLILEYRQRNGRLGMATINFLSPMSI